MRSTKIFGLLVIFVMISMVFSGTLFAGGGQEAPKEQKAEDFNQVKIRLAHVLDTKNNLHVGAVRFKELVEEKTNGNVVIEIYPSSQLGGERDIAEGLRMGTVESAILSTVILTPFIGQAGVFGLPYTYRDIAHATKVVNGPVGKKFCEETLPTVGIRGLGFMHAGFRHIFTREKPVKSLEDMEGVKIRIQEDPMQKDLWTALGASAVPVPYPELYTALQTGVVDAAEQPLASLYTMRFWEVTKNITLTGHYYQTYIIMMGDKFWNTLNEKTKKTISEAAEAAAAYQLEVNIKDNEAAADKLRNEGGMEIFEVNTSAFAEAAKDVTEKYAAKWEGGLELLKAIRAQ